MQAQVMNMRQSVAQAENRLRALQAQQLGPMAGIAVDQEIAKIKEEIGLRRLALERMLKHVAPPGVPNTMNMNPMATSPVPPQRTASAVQPNPAQVGWMQQQEPSPAHQFNSPRPGPMGSHLIPNGNAQQPNLQMNTPQLPQQIAASQQNQHVQRPVTTPLQVLSTGVPPSVSHPGQNGMQNGFANGGMGNSNGQPGLATQSSQQQQQPQQPQTQGQGFAVRPLSKETFNTMYYQNFLPRLGKDQALLMLDNRKVDLYQLHCEVTNAGGVTRVVQGDLWSIIGARLGFVHIPGTDTEPARSGPGLALRLQAIYKDFLLGFDRQYFIMMARRHQQMMNAKLTNGNTENGHASQGGANGTSSGPEPRPLSGIQPQHMNELIMYSVHSAADLQRQGVPQHIIQIVEQNRDSLRQMFESQRAWRNRIAANSQNGQNQTGAGPLMPSTQNGANPMQNQQQAGMMAGQNGMRSLGQPNGQALPPQAVNQGAPQGATMSQGVPQQPQQQMGVNVGQGAVRPMRPSPAQQQAAIETVRKVRAECKNASFANRQTFAIPDGQRMEYNTVFEYLFRLTSDLDQKLHMYACVMKEDAIKKLALMVLAVQQQREFLSGGMPRYFLQLEQVKAMTKQVQTATEAFKAYMMGLAPNMHSVAQPPNTSSPSQAQQAAAAVMAAGQVRQIAASALQPPAVAPPAQSPPAPSPAIATMSTPIQKKPTPKPAAETPSAPTPSAATPAASAPTPTHAVSSPQTPKSPKSKPTPKPKQPPKPRKVSTKTQPATPSAAPAASPAAGPSEVKPPATPATPANAPTPDTSSSAKRPREEEPVASSSVSASAAAQPAAKKIKTEFDEPPSETLSKRQAQADAVKTDEDAVKFFEQMSNWLDQVSGGEDGQESLKSEIADSLDQILKAYPDVPDDSGLSSMNSNFFDSFTIGSSSPKQGAATVDPSDFFDFSSYGLPEEEAGSKAATPDLVQASSSVGPSPGSASETEAHPPASSTSDTAKIADPKSEPGDDAIPQELWRAFDGGESAFYNTSDGWKWDQPMPAAEQPWAFYPS
ncbi:hypothetical protein C8Q79DRAFT_1116664 [Trametes meyenii]|nr:hypothetical protein C8Q79DRAFT_1116664 [Trametes meyenii]